MKKLIYTICLSALLSVSGAIHAQESEHFISETLYTFMHSGPSNEYRIIGSVTSATPVTLLGKSEDGAYVQIKDPKGREGWIDANALDSGATRQQQLDALSQQLESVSLEMQQRQQSVASFQSEIDNLKQTIADKEQALIKAQQQLETLQVRLAGLGDETEMKWFMNGGAVAGGGVLLGLLLSLISRRKRRDNWM